MIDGRWHTGPAWATYMARPETASPVGTTSSSDSGKGRNRAGRRGGMRPTGNSAALDALMYIVPAAKRHPCPAPYSRSAFAYSNCYDTSL